ncbi:MAG: ParA family protein [Deinococcales bacterium]|nr:ParA family protein [Deinococcales bacterium]
MGKTTTAVNLAAAIARRHSVLLIDMDPQANASSGLGILNPQKTVYDVLIGNATAETIVSETSLPGLDILASSPELAGAAMDLDTNTENMLLLSKALIVTRSKYDFIVLDAPPSIGALTLNVLAAADHLIIPLQAEYYGLEGIAHMMDTITRVQGSLNPSLTVLGILLTMFDSRTRLSVQVEENVRQHFGPLVFKAVIPRSVRLAEAPSFGQPALEFAPISSGAKAYQALSREVIERVSQT